jgi:hypothetical protein
LSSPAKEQPQHLKIHRRNPRTPPTFGQHFPQTTPLPSHVTLHLTLRQQAEIVASTKCRDAWLCKGIAAKAYSFDSHALHQPVDVLEYIHLDRRDPLRLRARNFTSPLLAARRRFFQHRYCSLGESGMSPCALGMLICSSYHGISIKIVRSLSLFFLRSHSRIHSLSRCQNSSQRNKSSNRRPRMSCHLRSLHLAPTGHGIARHSSMPSSLAWWVSWHLGYGTQ